MVLCKDCEYNKETNLFHTGRYCMRLGAICGLLGCEEGVPKVKTNADRIRSMTYEELSSWINDHADCNSRCEAWKDGCMDSDSTCRAAWLEWLEKEVKE